MTIEQLIEKLEGLKSRNPYAEVVFHLEDDITDRDVKQEIEGAVYDPSLRKVILN